VYEAWVQYLPLDNVDRDFILSGVKSGIHIVDTANISGHVRQHNHLFQ
jgi:hypothetical protein